MSWILNYSKDADKFLKKHPSEKEKLIKEIKKLILFLDGETVNIDLKKLTGSWGGFYRIRKGQIRIILQIDSNELSILIYAIDFRGNIY